MHYQTELFQVSPRCYRYSFVVVVVVAVVVCGGHGDDGFVA